MAEGWLKQLEWRSPNHIYRPLGCRKIKLHLKNYRLSDDIAFRFSDHNWKDWPLTPAKYIDWLNMDCLRGNLINLFMDFETFGEHQWADTGIFEFMDEFISKWLSIYDNTFLTLSEANAKFEPVGDISMPNTVTWADSERDLSAWASNSMQNTATKELYALKKSIFATKDTKLIEDWRNLTTSDHPYSMCTKYWNDGDVHAYFSAYNSPYESFVYFSNILKDLKFRARKIASKTRLSNRTED